MADDAVTQARGELYGLDRNQFTSRRMALADQARSVGNHAAAKTIAALGRPTQSAWALNQLARARPQLIGELTELGAQLVQAQRALARAPLGCPSSGAPRRSHPTSDNQRTEKRHRVP